LNENYLLFFLLHADDQDECRQNYRCTNIGFVI